MSPPPCSHAPIAIFAYNRRDRLATMMESLAACDGFDQSTVKIFVDGPKNEAGAPAVEDVRELVRSLPYPNVQHVISEKNSGLRNAISAGVSRIVEEHGRVIVLEDDLVLSPIALTYFNQALDYYQQDEMIWSVVGYMYDCPSMRDEGKTVTLPFTHPWGWATWNRAWKHFELDGRPSDADLESAAFRSAFDMNGLYPFTGQLRNSIRGRVNSWYIHWYYALFRHGARSIFPPRRVLDNFGMNTGSHASSLNPFDRLVERPELLAILPTFSDPHVVDYAALDALRSCWEMKVHRWIAEAGALKRKLKGSK